VIGVLAIEVPKSILVVYFSLFPFSCFSSSINRITISGITFFVKHYFKHIARVASTIVMVLVVTFASLVPGSSMKNEYPANEAPKVYSRVGPAHDRTTRDAAEWEHYTLVKRYARAYRIDFRLILAIIRVESQFNHDAVSERGARGLMQIMPVTNAEVAEELELDSITLPAENLRGGIFYFSKLVNLFSHAASEDRLCFALAAYNAGPSRLYDAQELAAYFGENPNSWESVQHFLPLLSKRYDSLHRLVWKTGRPPSGYFGCGKMAVRYVKNVMHAFKNVKNEV